jgi:hypothetical protein
MTKKHLIEKLLNPITSYLRDPVLTKDVHYSWKEYWSLMIIYDYNTFSIRYEPRNICKLNFLLSPYRALETKQHVSPT